MSTNNGTLVIEDDGDGIAEVSPARVIGDAEKLERLEKNLARAEEMRKVGMNDQADIETEHSDATNHGDSNTKKKRSKGKSAKEGETVFAPSIDEVTTDNDHLASLRDVHNVKLLFATLVVKLMIIMKLNAQIQCGANLPKELISQYNDTQNRNSGNNNNRKRNYDTANNVNYNYAPPPYPRYNNYNNNNGNRSGNNNYKNRNYNNNKYKNSNLPSGPTKSGYLANKNNYGNQGRNNNYSNSNYNNQRNSNSYNSRSSYFNSRRY
ncbi:hypothetical protein BOH78_2325 [Pichia kudriavzevii]|uniref:Uncharacterized protein n=1 Tax=Pichia kudriavzevii TaxID=4909 RepID=A0A1V2LPP4_PICKU|nr:hypothetical protein BOH78_2325 [Pichia kudriavzevii]